MMLRRPVSDPRFVQTGRDPSTAWRTPAGEWRITSFGSHVYGSMDFKTWYSIGVQHAFPAGECPSFFPLPKATAGSGSAPAGAATPTHVVKSSHGGKDWMMVGTYQAGAPRELGAFNSTPGVPYAEVLIDRGAFYASKDFYDPVKQRRLLAGWATIAVRSGRVSDPQRSTHMHTPRLCLESSI
jgi:beta-fructofuranosidase